MLKFNGRAIVELYNEIRLHVALAETVPSEYARPASIVAESPGVGGAGD